jgi:hypothetical protein
MTEKGFDNQIADAQGTNIEPIDVDSFDIVKYEDYEASLLEKNRQFWASDSGIAVYRRFRVPQVFTYGCKDMKYSLALQLAALTESMKYKADIANFLEPWYGLGTTASSFGLDYEWPEGQSPTIKAPFKTVEEALKYNVVPIEQTAIGKHTLEMIEYFLDKTQGKIPMSPTDTQSPLDTASYLIDINNLLMSPFDNPDGLKKLLNIISDLLIDFTKKQIELIGEALVMPGHGFAASRNFTGLGMSDDVMMMLSGQQYAEFEVPILAKVGENFGGAVFHSCGNWSPKIAAVKKIRNLVMVDGAFSAQTDPDPNPAEPFADAFAGTNIAVNARIVGRPDVVIDKVKRLYSPGMKLIVVTYCKTPTEQEEVYEKIHAIA